MKRVHIFLFFIFIYPFLPIYRPHHHPNQLINQSINQSFVLFMPKKQQKVKIQLTSFVSWMIVLSFFLTTIVLTKITTTTTTASGMFVVLVEAAMSTALPTSSSNERYFMGFDLGTSGARISVIQKIPHPAKTLNTFLYKELHSDSVLYESYDDPTCWVAAVDTLLLKTPMALRSRTQSICISGTSASCLLVDGLRGTSTRGTRAKMYDFDVMNNNNNKNNDNNNNNNNNNNPVAAIQVQQWMEQHVPAHHVARSNTSALAKLLHYHACQPIQSDSFRCEVLAHQSEYVATTVFLSSQGGYKCGAGLSANRRHYVSDWHNALKLGYDVKGLQYPQWLLRLFNEIGIPLGVLPKVVEPGQPVGPVSREARDKYGFSEQTMVVGGTTDSNASFMAAVVGRCDSSGSDGGDGNVQHGGSLLDHYGIAVTSLGSTLAIKMLSRTFVEDCERGVYSHRFPSMGNGVPQVAKDHHERNDKGNDKGNDKENDTSQLWLVGGASNVGCAVLRQEKFSNQELMELSNDMDVMTDSEFSYYPLTKQGERFPIADGSKEPILEPKPKSRQEYLKAILQGISKVERMGYDTLGNLGASPPFPTIIMTTGGGSKNEKWLQMRQRLLMQPCQDSSRTSSSRSSDSTAETVVGEPSFVKVLKAENTEASFGAAILAASQVVSSTISS